MLTANEIRQQFIDFFCKKHGHTFVPSSPVVPHDDPTLLFTNAGMNQFKPYFLGTAKPPFLRAANTQKCIRAGGKHNDLDDVGKDTYHHTFFEMLGNWSFGDYFKKEAIHWAWELLTDVWGMDKSRLHVTVFEGDPENNVPRDDEAAQHWRDVGVPDAQIHLGNKKDNFWEMGETGPCGPCTEVHYDKTPGKVGGPLVNKGTPEVIEIWNLVFIQFNRNADRSLTPLPAKHVDTGMGFERVTAVLQGMDSNYDTDVFAPIMDAIGSLVGKKYGGRLNALDDIAFRVVSDHLRTLAFSISDGALPSNKGRGAVIRSVLRRAFRFGFERFLQRTPFLYRLVPVIVGQMGTAFPELSLDPARVQDVIRSEEADFLETIERGLKYYEEEESKVRHSSRLPRRIPYGSPSLSAAEEDARPHTKFVSVTGKFSGEAVFRLYTTYGFPPDLTRQKAAERGLEIDEDEYQRLMTEHSQTSRVKARTSQVALNVQGDLPKSNDTAKYESLATSAQLLGWVEDNTVFSGGLVPHNRPVGLLLDRTCFYAEAGGQVGDSGTITSGTGAFQVESTQKLGDTVLHVGQLPEGLLEVGQHVKLQVAPSVRLDTMRNHTSTHLLNLALRKVLGEHVEQKGSLVDPEKTRFDFSHEKPVLADEIAEIERIVNEEVARDRPVTAVVMPLGDAKKIPGVRAVFGEKYPDPVRVVLIGPDDVASATADDSVEFCGGTHLNRTSQAGLFKIVSQEAVGKGVRRLTAVTGRGAFAAVQKIASVVGTLTEKFRCSLEDLPTRIESLQDEVKKLQTQLKKGQSGDLAGAIDKLLADAPEMHGAKIIIGELTGATMEQARLQSDRIISKAGNCVIVLGWKEEEKVGLRVVVTSDLTKKVHAGNLIKEIVAIVGGKGGGKPDKAEAGGSQPEKLGEALALAKQRVTEAFSS